MRSASAALQDQAAKCALRQYAIRNDLKSSTSYAEGTEGYFQGDEWSRVVTYALNKHMKSSGNTTAASKSSVTGCCVVRPHREGDSGVYVKVLSLSRSRLGYNMKRSAIYYDRKEGYDSLKSLEPMPTEVLDNSLNYQTGTQAFISKNSAGWENGLQQMLNTLPALKFDRDRPDLNSIEGRVEWDDPDDLFGKSVKISFRSTVNHDSTSNTLKSENIISEWQYNGTMIRELSARGASILLSEQSQDGLDA